MSAISPATAPLPAAPASGCPPSDYAARRLARGVYRVPSLTTPGQWYVVYRDDQGFWRCECEAASFGRPCAHVGALVALEERGEIAK